MKQVRKISRIFTSDGTTPYANYSVLVFESGKNTPARLYDLFGRLINSKGITFTDADGLCEFYVYSDREYSMSLRSSTGVELTSVAAAPESGVTLSPSAGSGVGGGESGSSYFSMTFPMSARGVDLETTGGTAYFRAPRPFILTAYRTSVRVPSSSGSISVSFSINGVNLSEEYSTIDQATTSSLDYSGNPSSLGNGSGPVDFILVDEDALIEFQTEPPGLGVGAQELKVTILGYWNDTPAAPPTIA